MGIDYLSCHSCGESFPDVCDYVSCDCGNDWCDNDCAKEDGYIGEHCKLEYDMEDNECGKSCYYCENFIESSCNFCRSEDFEDNELLSLAMELLCLNREELIKLHKLKNK